MNINEFIEEREKEIELANLVNEMAFIHQVRFISKNSVFFKEDVNIETIRRVIRQYCGHEKLERYYMNSQNQLALEYETPDGKEWLFFITGTQEELQEILNRISKGKCQIKSQVNTTTETFISCEIE